MARTRRRAITHQGSGPHPSDSDSDGLAPRMSSMDPKERLERQRKILQRSKQALPAHNAPRDKLSRGLYNFRDVKTYFFSQEGWWTKQGPSLSYDHFYIKPDKNPSNPNDVHGVDYFLGEAALVKYARALKIFGDDTIHLDVDTDEQQLQPPAATPLGAGRGKRRARSGSSSQARAEQHNVSDSDSDRMKREHQSKRRRRRLGQKNGNALNPISFSSDTSDCEGAGIGDSSVEDDDDDEWSEGDRYGGFDQEEDKDDEEEEEEEEEDDEEEDGESSEEKEAEASEEDVEVSQSSKGPRPLLKTSNKFPLKKKKKRVEEIIQPPKGQRHGVVQAPRASVHKRAGKKAKAAPRSLLASLRSEDTHDGDWRDNDDTSFDLDVEEYGESPPRRPPTKARLKTHHNAKIARRTTLHPTAAAATRAREEEEKGSPPVRNASPHSFISASPPAAASASASPALSVSASTSPRSASATNTTQILMELTEVALPPDFADKYHVRITVSPTKPPVTTIWMENLSTNEQRQCSFGEVEELPDADNKGVPTAAVLTALFRRLSTRPGAVVLVGLEPQATAESKTDFEMGRVELLSSTAEKTTGAIDTTDSGNTLTLHVVYPDLDLFQAWRKFPMTLVPTNQRLRYVMEDLKRTKEQLAHVQSDRDKLCEQLQQQEEESERTRAKLVEAERTMTESTRLLQQLRTQQDGTVDRHAAETVAAETTQLQQQLQAQQEEMESRVAALVEEKLRQAEERRTNERERASRCVYARSDWMLAFEPCRALIAAVTAEREAPASAATTLVTPTKYLVAWNDIVEIAEPFFQRIAANVAGAGPSSSTRAFAVVKDGSYQVNVNVSHESTVQLRLVVTSASVGAGVPSEVAAATREIDPTTVELYDGKRRVSRVDRKLNLRALDQVTVELNMMDPSLALPSVEEDWLRTPMPTHNRLMIVVLNEYAVHQQPQDA
ncbi:hypothetical protein BBJ28_00011360 [Nothophytophthora sp. Chile5]|nr:hypothetical protein BBJ28_00011360 [Nothophytophthora sp. Chile5]